MSEHRFYPSHVYSRSCPISLGIQKVKGTDILRTPVPAKVPKARAAAGPSPRGKSRSMDSGRHGDRFPILKFAVFTWEWREGWWCPAGGSGRGRCGLHDLHREASGGR